MGTNERILKGDEGDEIIKDDQGDLDILDMDDDGKKDGQPTALEKKK